MKKTILITGTSRGIGLALAKHFLNLDFSVVGVSRGATPLEHENFYSLQADLSRPEDVENLKTKLQSFSLSGFIHNAGVITPMGPFAENNFHDWTNTFQVNLFSGGRLVQFGLPSLRKNHGFIIFLSGGGSAYPNPNFSAYGVSKTAVVRLSEVLAKELAPDIFVYCVAPGPNPTKMLEQAIQNGVVVPEENKVDFSYPIRLCEFLAFNQNPGYSGKFIHVKDNYREWGEKEFAGDGYTLRRIKN
ncbi:MAG: SDR family oxidoreductase [Deltaproteobacteria bacterium]|nr:SDR family oxidoreductase [Deltaproteobacteria bacterium]